jgi:hypothetical protein
VPFARTGKSLEFGWVQFPNCRRKTKRDRSVIEIDAQSFRLKEAKELNAARSGAAEGPRDHVTGEGHRSRLLFTGELQRLDADLNDHQHRGGSTER